jgi:hypothetical protein
MRYVRLLIYTDYSAVMFKSFVHKDLWRNDYSAVTLKLKLDQEMWPNGHILLGGVVCVRASRRVVIVNFWGQISVKWPPAAPTARLAPRVPIACILLEKGLTRSMLGVPAEARAFSC